MLDKKYLKRVGLYIGGSLLAIGVVCYLGYHLWQSVTREIETTPAIPDEFSVTAEYDAWVFRDEKVIPLSDGQSGTVIPSLRDGERVGKTAAVGSIYPSVTKEHRAELDTVRSQIRILESQHSSSVGGDLGIGEAMLDLTSSTKNGNLTSVHGISSKLAALVSLRTSDKGNAADVIEILKDKESQLLSSFGSSSGTVYTPYSGWYYSSTDGYESVFTPEAVIGITPDGLDQLLATPPADASSAGGRIVCTYKWYIATVMNASDGSAFREGDTTTVELQGFSEPVQLTVESVVNGVNNRTAVVFSCATIPDGIDTGRHMTVEFTLSQVTGFGIPKEAVRIQDGITGVYTYNGVVVKFRKIEILAEYDDMYIAAIRDNIEAIPDIPAETTDGEAAETEKPLGDGAGRHTYYWLEANEFIVIKGKALYNGRVIG